MYCPRCSATAPEGQRFCRGCGMNLGIILDAIEGKRGTLDFEVLKRDLRELGASLRSGFSHGSERNTARLGTEPRADVASARPGAPATPAAIEEAVAAIRRAGWSKEFDRALRKVKAAHSRKYSLQQSILSLFGGGAIMAAWYYVLNAAATSGLIESIEQVILRESGHPVTGIAAVVRALWVLGLIPVATGVAHLINGIFLAPTQAVEPEPPRIELVREPQPVTPPPTAPPTSVTEEPTIRFKG